MTFIEFRDLIERPVSFLSTPAHTSYIPVSSMAKTLDLYAEMKKQMRASPQTGVVQDLWHVLPQKYKDMDVDAFRTMVFLKGVMEVEP